MYITIFPLWVKHRYRETENGVISLSSSRQYKKDLSTGRLPLIEKMLRHLLHVCELANGSKVCLNFGVSVQRVDLLLLNAPVL